jgi:hypothetical protein
MFSGLLFTKHSGKWLGAHQKFNRLAYKAVLPYVNAKNFPPIKQIQHFEGRNGPDGLKIKSSGQHEPWHFYDPLHEVGDVPVDIANHYRLLVWALRGKDQVRAAFEASWLAHVIVDGLTPAHHHDAIKETRKDAAVTKVRDKMIIKGGSRADTIKRTWKLMGVKGSLSSHFNFELGIAAALAASKFQVPISQLELEQAKLNGPVDYFKQQAKTVHHLRMYQRFMKKGWTIGLARQVKKILAPTISQTIAMIWIMAYQEALAKNHADS